MNTTRPLVSESYCLRLDIIGYKTHTKKRYKSLLLQESIRSLYPSLKTGSTTCSRSQQTIPLRVPFQGSIKLIQRERFSFTKNTTSYQTLTNPRDLDFSDPTISEYGSQSIPMSDLKQIKLCQN